MLDAVYKAVYEATPSRCLKMIPLKHLSINTVSYINMNGHPS